MNTKPAQRRIWVDIKEHIQGGTLNHMLTVLSHNLPVFLLAESSKTVVIIILCFTDKEKITLKRQRIS